MKILNDGKEVEAVNEFKYLGSMIADDGRCETEIRKRNWESKIKLHRQ